jgi:hypothetical protein
MSHARICYLLIPALALCASCVLRAPGALAQALAQDAAQQPQLASMAAPLEKSRQAIAECRDRRLRGEIATYKESAECSSPKIFAAWREAAYPHMDLITAWVNAREAASAQVDQKTLTPDEFERQMGELTVRLTGEERRRRGGLVNAADNGLELQLPASTKVVAVATPAGKEKQAKKKTEAARAAASVPYVDPGAGNSVQAMGSVSNLDSRKKKGAAAGVGGPFVPVPDTTGSTRVASTGAPPQGAGGLYAHLASQRSDADARTAFRTLQQQYPSILGGRDAVIRRADVSGQGTYYRVEIGPLSPGQADQLCGSLKAAGGQCVTQYE